MFGAIKTDKNMRIVQMETSRTTIKEQVADISTAICWGEISEVYFGKSPAWLSLKMRGKGFNGQAVGDFTPEEKEIFVGALVDLADRIRSVAEKIR